MTIKFFPAAIVDDDGSFFVQFVDIPAAFTVGRTFEHALEMARDVIDLVLEELHARGEKIPAPTAYADAAARLGHVLDKRLRKKVLSIQMIPGAVPGKAVRVMISVEEELLQRIDNAAGPYGRSGFLADAAREKLADRTSAYGFGEEKQGFGRQMERAKKRK